MELNEVIQCFSTHPFQLHAYLTGMHSHIMVYVMIIRIPRLAPESTTEFIIRSITPPALPLSC